MPQQSSSDVEEARPLLSDRSSSTRRGSNHSASSSSPSIAARRRGSNGLHGLLGEHEAKECYDKALQLARDTVTEPLKPELLSDGDAIITDDMLHDLHSLSRRACVYGCIAAHRILSERARRSIHRTDLLRSRALFCETMAVRLVEKMAEKKVGREELFVEVLTPLFTSLQDGHNEESPLQVAVESDAVQFINSLTVQQCVEYIWRGLLVPRPSLDIKMDSEDGDGYVQGYQWPEEIQVGFRALPEGRLGVPLYRYAAETAFSFILLAVFTFVVNYRTPEFNAFELLMYFLVLSFGFSEIKQFCAQGFDFYFLTLFNGIDVISMTIFTIAFVFRCYGQWIGSDQILDGPNDMAYDLLACNAVFLWTRAIHVLAGFRYFGEMVVIIRSMMRDAAYFFIMFSFVLVGFVQAFAGLARATPAEGPGFGKGIYLLAKAFLQSPDFDEAEGMHDVLGPPLLIFFMVLASVIMLNMLIAFFNQSYTVVVESASQQHVFQFTVNVLGIYLDATRYPFISPTNLLEPFLYVPHLVLSEARYLDLRRWVWIAACLPGNLAIAVAEEVMPNTTARIYKVKEDREFEEEQKEEAGRREEDGQDQPVEKDAGRKAVEKEGDGKDKGERGTGGESDGVQATLRSLVDEIKALRKEVDGLKKTKGS
ncbi:hypothetical protein HKX48_004833 [Thoreauomyces humboldtii]|nr:hypothetical protein HKX48_004833 [Thoreauomyces humboldtii]